MQNNFSLSVEEDVFTHVIENTDLSPEGLKKWKKEVLFFFFSLGPGVCFILLHAHSQDKPASVALYYTAGNDLELILLWMLSEQIFSMWYLIFQQTY